MLEKQATAGMANREDFLQRVRKALGRSPGNYMAPRVPSQLFPPLGPVLPPISGVVEKFEEELQKVSGSTYRAATASELAAILQNIHQARQAKVAVLSRNPILAQLRLAEALAGLGVSAHAWAEAEAGEPESEPARDFRDHAFAAEVGITGVDFVLAESGTLVLTSLTEGSQLTSLAPPVHIALYRRSQALATLEEVLDRLPVPLDPESPLPGRSVVFITGPSRTADIEQILIRGVHGPKEVHAILVEESCLG
jgi:L-lactate dehydrogenase complex protein LldG